MLGIVAGIIPILLIISVIVTFHELGHYGVARLFNTRIERFSVGFGKVLLKRVDKRGVEWCLSAIPLGGYVKFAGDENIASMMPSAEDLEAARVTITEREGAEAVGDYFYFKPLWQRFLIILAGPVANFVLAIFILSILNFAFGEAIVTPTVTRIEAGSAAEAAGFQLGDTVKSVDGQAVNSELDVRRLVQVRADTAIKIVVERKSQLVTLDVTPRRADIDTGDGKTTVKGGRVGVELHGDIIRRPLNPIEAIQRGTIQTWQVLDTTLTYIGRIFTGRENGDQISSIVGMTKAAGDAAVDVAQTKQSLTAKTINLALTYVQFIALISIGVGFLNLLPIPILDGGHLAFYVYQGITRKPVPAAVQNVAYRIAAALILGLMLYAVWNDINRTGLTKMIGGLFS